MHGKNFMRVCMYACMHDHVQVRRKYGGLKFKVKESWVDTVSGESRALNNSNRVLKSSQVATSLTYITLTRDKHSLHEYA
jgi:hypothetical protein